MSGWMIGPVGLAVALLCTLLMGLALQRGGTCTVAAVHQLVVARQPTKLLALLEAAAWVGALVWVARQAGWLGHWPGGWAFSGWTVAGAMVLAAGAVLNGACALGTVAQLGQGNWAYAATPLGFYAGYRLAVAAGGQGLAQALPGATPPLAAAPGWALVVLGLLALWRLLRLLLRLPGPWGLLGKQSSSLTQTHGAADIAAWSPHLATVSLGLLFGLLMVLAGAWAYTDVLAELATAMRAMAGTGPDTTAAPAGLQGLLPRVLLALALLTGAVGGGWLGAAWRPRRPRWQPVLRCLAGGALMGAGSLLVPGGNDGLVLIGLPLLWPYAWAAMATMVTTVGLALLAPRVWARWRV